MSAQALWSMSQESVTWDESYAIAAGFRQVAEGDFRLVRENPPLLGLLVSGPLALLGARLPPIPEGELKAAAAPEYGFRFFFRAGNPHERILFWARLMVLALSAASAALCVVWSHALFGARAAWLAGILCAFEPNWNAHGHLAAWDGIAAASMTFAFAALGYFLQRPGARSALVAGAALGTALAAKHTALLLLPCAGLLGLVRILRPGWFTPSGTPPKALRVVEGALLAGAVAALVLGATYGFHYDLYLDSVRSIYRMNDPQYENYLVGEFSTQPFRAYYLAALLVKTPLSFLALLPLGLAAPTPGRRALWAPAAVGIALLLSATAFNRYNIGIRHVVPAIPLVIVLASGAAALPGRRVGALSMLLGLLGAAEVLSQAPHHLSFFNWASGGPRAGIRFLDDSNLDWGQDLKRLAALQRGEHLGTIALAFHGLADPLAYGVRARPIRDREFLSPDSGTVYAVSVHLLNRLPRRLGPEADWLNRHKPWRIAGRSIYLYRFDGQSGRAPP